MLAPPRRQGQRLAGHDVGVAAAPEMTKQISMLDKPLNISNAFGQIIIVTLNKRCHKTAVGYRN